MEDRADPNGRELTFTDSQGRLIRLPETQLQHIFHRHSEMYGMEWAIGETLEAPVSTLPSVKDPESVLEYFRWFPNTSRGGKYVRVVVKFEPDDAFVLTAHLARRIPQRGE